MAEKVLAQPTTQDTVVVGKNVFLYINYGENASESSPVWCLIGGQRSTNVEMESDEIDASHKTSGGWKITKAGLRSWSFSADAVVLLGDDGAKAAKLAFTSGVAAQFRIVTKNDAGTVLEAENGWGNVTSFSKEAPHDDVATISMEISGNGALTEESNPT